MGKARWAKLRRGKRNAAGGLITPERQIGLGMADPQHGKPRQPRPQRGQAPAQQPRGQPARRRGIESREAIPWH